MTTIQIWIDLWTTNSAVAVNRNGNIEIIKNLERDEFTPSVFGFDKAKNKLVWKKAYEKLFKFLDKEDLENFKASISIEEFEFYSSIFENYDYKKIWFEIPNL